MSGELLISITKIRMDMKAKTLLITLLFLTSILAGCAGNDSDASKDDEILSLESEISNLTAENDEIIANNIVLQETLDSANQQLEKSDKDIENLSLSLVNLESHRDNLSASLSVTMEELNRTQDTSLLAQLENQVSNLTTEINTANSDISDLNDEITIKQTEAEQLTATVTALQSTISSLTYDMRMKIGNCPMDNPGIEIIAGFDDGAGSAVSDDGILHDDEIQFTVGECNGDYGRILNMSENSWGPQLMVKMGNKLIFGADDGIHSWEPWRTDGTVEGTYMIKDVRPEECTTNNDGVETCENYGSLSVADFTGINRGYYYPELVAGNNKFFFTGYEDAPSVYMAEVFVSDGTEAGTHLIQDQWTHDYFSDNDWWEFFYVGPTNLHVIPSQGNYPDRLVYSGFWAHSGDVTGEEPYLTDGTTTIRMANIVPEITEAGPYCCFDFLGSMPRDFIHNGNLIYFSATSNDNGRELYRYNLAAFGNNGLFLIEDLKVGVEGSNPEHITPISDGKLYFTADTGSETGRELYFSEGSSSNTDIIVDIWPGDGNSSNPDNLISHGENIFFTANDGQNGVELWYSDGSMSGTFMIKDINVNGSSDPRRFVLSDDTLYFTAYNEEYGRELWISDGTEEGTTMVMDIYSGQNSTFDYGAPYDNFGNQLIIHKEMIYFTANSPEYGYEIWHSDGTENGTQILLDLNPGTNSSYPWWLTSFGDKLYFTAAEEDPYPFNGRQMYYYWDNPGPIIDIE